MRLIDCFFEVLYLTVELVDEFKKDPTRKFDEIRLQLERAILENKSNQVVFNYSEEQYQLAFFAVAAFIDEKMLTSQWQHKEQWRKEMLQTIHFDTIKGGELFFSNLAGLSSFDPAERDIREVYYYCLMLGYRGKFYQESDQNELEQLKKENLSLLKAFDEKHQNSTQTAHLFPKAYVTGKKGTGIKLHIDSRPFVFGIPLIILLVLFYLFKLELNQAANYLISTI
jgi:type VI secretion system protein ImpK